MIKKNFFKTKCTILAEGGGGGGLGSGREEGAQPRQRRSARVGAWYSMWGGEERQT
jgi:hypothetical protein